MHPNRKSADDRSQATKIQINSISKGRKQCGERENAGYQHFLLFPHPFQKPSSKVSLKLGLCDKEVMSRYLPHRPTFQK